MFFTKKKTPKTEPAAKAAAAGIEAEIPDPGLVKAREEYADSTGQPHVAASRNFVMFLVVSLIALIEAWALKTLPPNIQVKPYVVMVNPEKGEVRTERNAGIPAAEYRPDEAVIDRELFNFVKNLYAMNADAVPVIQQAQGEAYAYTRDRASAEFRDFIKKEQVYQRMKTTPGLTRTVDKRTISHRTDAPVVLIRFTSIERSKGQTDGIRREIAMQITYTRVQPTDKDELDRNPLGIYITHFDPQEEN